MASMLFSKSLVLFLALNLLFFSLVSACGECGSGSGSGSGSGYPKKPSPKPNPKPSTPYPGSRGGYPGSGGTPSTGGGGGGGGSSIGACPPDTLKLGVCANVLNGLVNLNLGAPPKMPCCPLIQGLIDAEAAVCLCTAIRANILGIVNLNIPLSLSSLVNYCGTKVPHGFQCP